MSESETVAKNCIEFQWGSKLQGTSSEALGGTALHETYAAGQEELGSLQMIQHIIDGK